MLTLVQYLHEKLTVFVIWLHTKPMVLLNFLNAALVTGNKCNSDKQIILIQTFFTFQDVLFDIQCHTHVSNCPDKLTCNICFH